MAAYGNNSLLWHLRSTSPSTHFVFIAFTSESEERPKSMISYGKIWQDTKYQQTFQWNSAERKMANFPNK